MDNSSTPSTSGSRTPPAPPVTVATGFAPDPDDYLDRLSSEIRKAEFREGLGAELPVQLPPDLEGDSSVDATILRLLDSVSNMDSEQLRSVLEVVTARRDHLADQLEMERTVLRPPRQGRLPQWGNDELLAGYERTIAIYDKVLARAAEATRTRSDSVEVAGTVDVDGDSA